LSESSDIKILKELNQNQAEQISALLSLADMREGVIERMGLVIKNQEAQLSSYLQRNRLSTDP
jgi:hypothetical protein